MRWTAQVRHVLAKDLAQTWKWPVLLAIATVVSALRAVGWIPNIVNWDWIFVWGTMGVVLMAMLAIVRADPPADSTAFWSTQPFCRSAVAAAKVAYAGLLLALLQAGSFFVMVAWKLDAGQGLRILGHLTAAVFAIASFAIFAVAVSAYGAYGASKTRALPGLVYMLASLSFTLSFMYPHAKSVVSAAIDTIPVLAWVPLLLASALTFRKLYLAREQSVALQATAMLMAVLPGVLFLRGDAGPAEPSGSDADSTRMSARALWTPRPDMQLSIAVAVKGGDAGAMRFLLDTKVTAILRDSSRVAIWLSPTRLSRADGRIPAIATTGRPLRVFGAQPAERDSTLYVPIWISLYDVEKKLTGNVARFIVEGTLADYDVREVDRFPLRIGAAPVRDGRLITVRVTPPDTAGPVIQLTTRWLQTPDRDAPWSVPAPLWRSDLLFAAVDTVTGSQMPLRWKDIDYGDHPIALPGFGVAEMSHYLQPAVWSIARPPVMASWFTSAQLVVGTPVFRRSVRVRAEALIATP